MTSRLFKIVLMCVLLGLFGFVITGYKADLARTILIVLFGFAFVLASLEALKEYDEED